MGKLNGLIIEWLEINYIKKELINNQEYEKLAITRDKERNLEIRIIDECNLNILKPTSFSEGTSGRVRSYVKQYLTDKYEINYEELDMTDIKSCIRNLKLEQLNIK